MALSFTGAGISTATGPAVDMISTFKSMVLATTDPIASLRLGSVLAGESLVKGDSFALLFNTHTHPYLDVFLGSPPLGVPKITSPPLIPMVSPAHLSVKVKTA